ncbi:MAG: peptidoglycan/LPS O-acetylase OafA/YrhL [Planctomycetaceae bacterium]
MTRRREQSNSLVSVVNRSIFSPLPAAEFATTPHRASLMTDARLATKTSTTTTRRHDLDALRAIAMLLGIALHAALAYSDVPWVVQDSQKNELFGLFFVAVHGFRMPLFFLVSGFFTAMLWRKRGLNALIKHRAKRILLPCLLGLVTIVPAVVWVSVHANQLPAVVGGTAEKSSPAFVDAIRKNDLDTIESELKSGADVNAQEPTSGVTPLSWAALYGHAEATGLLIENGADLEEPNRDGARPLHAAAFLGRTKVVELLLKNGADKTAKDRKGVTALDTTYADWNTAQFIAGLLQLPKLDREELLNGQRKCRRLLGGESDEEPVVADVEPVRGDDESVFHGFVLAYTESINGNAFQVTDEFHAVATPVFHHLWFLWFLCWLVPIFAVYALIVDAVKLKALPKWLILSPARFLWLLPLTLVLQLFMGVQIPGFGPDTSVGLIPQPHILLYYGIFFGFGAVYFDFDDADGRLGRWWFVSLPLAIFLALPVGVASSFITPNRMVAAVAQVVYVWAMTFGMIGLFRKFMNSENRTMRYISDSSYWLYVAHLPLVMFAQGLVRDWPISPFVKFTLVCGVSTGILLLSYQTLVRYTWLGTLLNGPRTRPQPDTPSNPST